jgi:hypothetical protein
MADDSVSTLPEATITLPTPISLLGKFGKFLSNMHHSLEQNKQKDESVKVIKAGAKPKSSEALQDSTVLTKTTPPVDSTAQNCQKMHRSHQC